MKTAKKRICLLLAFALALCLSACRSEAEPVKAPDSAPNGGGSPATAATPSVTIPEPVASAETVPGYSSTEVPLPDWIASLGKTEMIGDAIYMRADTKDGGMAAASYDTMTDTWQRYDFDTGEALYPSVDNFTATEEAIWILLREGFSDEELESHNYSRSLEYYLVHIDLNTGEQTCSHVDFWREGSPYICSLIALDDRRCLVGDDDKVRLIDPAAQVIGMPDIRIPGTGFHAWVDGELYIDTADGFHRLDRESLRYDGLIEAIPTDRFVYGSSLGHFLFIESSALFSVDVTTGEKTKLFDWPDVALGYRRMCGWEGLENANGDIFHITDRLIKVSYGQIPVKKVLTLACFGSASKELSYPFNDTAYTIQSSLMDAVVRFNSTDPEYRIELKPLVYQDQAEQNRLLIELASGRDVDLIDTSLLPAGAVDGKMLVDLLPYIDADSSISREDFLPGVLSAMTKNGGLYEYTDKVTMLTVFTHPEFAGGWTAETILDLMAQHPEMRVPYGREKLVALFARAATAEFMNWSDMSFRFDSPEFISWLELLKALPAEEGEWSRNPYLFYFTGDYASLTGYQPRSLLNDQFVTAGFPGSGGTGSYFMDLGQFSDDRSGSFPDGTRTQGCKTSLGIMASGRNTDGAWRFVRSFMQGEEKPSLSEGIPVLRQAFERAVDWELERQQAADNRGFDFEFFNEQDAQALRELVYATDRMVCSDEAALNTIRTAINAYLDGKGMADETAQQIQSRLSLYMAELS